MKSKLKNLRERSSPLSCLHSAVGQWGSPPSLAVSAALRSLASRLVDILLLLSYFWAGADFTCEAGKGAI